MARRLKCLEELAAETKDLPGDAFAGDMLIKEQIEGMIVKFSKIRPWILVNNVGIMDDFSPVGEFTDEMFDKVMRLVFRSGLLMRRAVKIFEQNGGGNTSILPGGGLPGRRRLYRFQTRFNRFN